MKYLAWIQFIGIRGQAPLLVGNGHMTAMVVGNQPFMAKILMLKHLKTLAALILLVDKFCVSFFLKAEVKIYG